MRTTETVLEYYKRVNQNFVKILVHNAGYCGLCFDTNDLNPFNSTTQVSTLEKFGYVDIKTVVETVLLNQKTNPEISTMKNICNKCCSSAVLSYNFMQNIKINAETFENYLQQVNNSLNNIILQSEKGKQYDNAILHIRYPNTEPIYSQRDVSEKQTINNKSEQVNKEIAETKEKPKQNDKEKNSKDIITLINKYVCDYCGNMYKNKSKLKNHLHCHLNPKTVFYLCPECETEDCVHKEFLESYKKQRHEGSEKIVCPQCDYVCWVKPYLIGHANKVHLNIFHYHCEHCNKLLYSKQSYQSHMLAYHQKNYSCDLCPKKFKYPHYLARHKKICQGKKLFPCTHCPMSYDTILKLDNHLNSHKEDLQCDICDKSFTGKYFLEKHNREVHSESGFQLNNRIFFCSMCDETFTTYKEKKEHVKSHKQTEKHRCEICLKEFDTKSLYIKHKKSVKHLQTNNPYHRLPYKCALCSFSARAKDILEGHTNANHLKISPYDCKTCKKAFASKRCLNNHIKRHKPQQITCHICGKVFNGSQCLRMHIRRHHTFEKPYQCELCQEKFVNASSRNIHVLRKHSEKNIKCPLCDMIFYTIPNMRRHFKCVHWRKSSELDVTKIPGLRKEDYYLFRDGRQVLL